ncbi:MAG TPA: glycosyltransferase [Gemmatimonadales bacterium]|nr:glycosyltransferase [Gemmatimonadales bacterium]
MSQATVVHLVSTLGVGGQEMVILSLVEHIDRSKFRPVVMALHESGPVGAKIQSLGVEVETVGVPGLTGIPLVRRLAARLEARKVDVLHTHNPAPHQHGAAARLVTRIPGLVHTKHGRNNFATRTRRWAEQLAGRLTDVVVAVSHDSAEVARRIDRVPRHKLRVIHNGIAVDRLPRATVGRGGRPPRAVHVARLNRIKDQPTLLRAVRRVVDAIPEFRLDVVGDGPMDPIVRSLAAELGIEHAVSFNGMQDDIRPWLADADVFVLSSLSEGVSITLLEAMAAGLPAIATDVGGNREVVVSGETGLLVPPGNPELLAAAMIELLRDPLRAALLGAHGRERVATEFNIDRTVAEYEAIYIELLSRRGAPARRAA